MLGVEADGLTVFDVQSFILQNLCHDGELLTGAESAELLGTGSHKGQGQPRVLRLDLHLHGFGCVIKDLVTEE